MSSLSHVVQTIQLLFSPTTAPDVAKSLQHDLQQIQSSPDAWNLVSDLSTHEDPNVRFFSAHTAQIKISRDWDTLDPSFQPKLLALLLSNLRDATTPSNPLSHQPGSLMVVRKLFGCLASILLRLPFHLFPSPLLTVLSACPLPPLSLEWLSISVEEISRAGISDQKRNALRRHLEVDIAPVMSTITSAMPTHPEAACRCAESWINYSLGADELTALLPHLYSLLPHPSACSAIIEVLSESVFRYGKGTKILTEPLIAWCIAQPLTDEPSFAKLVCAIVEHSSEWIVTRMTEPDVQAFMKMILRLTDWPGIPNVEEEVSEITLPIYPLIQEAIMDNLPDHNVAKSFFTELVSITRRKCQWQDLDKTDREAFETWRRDAGEVIIGSYYILREEMLKHLVDTLIQPTWQETESGLHLLRYCSEGIPLGEEESLPRLFSDRILSQLSDDRLRSTTICVIQSNEEWFKFHPDHLLPVLSYLVPSLTSPASRYAADALKALCDICRDKLVPHISAFSHLHDNLGTIEPEDQTKVIEAITSVIQALPPSDAIEPIENIIGPLLNPLNIPALTASFKGLAPSDDFDLDVDDTPILATRDDPRLIALRARIEHAVQQNIWSGDSETLSSLVKHAASPITLISLSPLSLLTVVTAASEHSPSWLSSASTLVIRIETSPEVWDTIADCATRLAVVAQSINMRDDPDIVESWFKFCSALATRYPGILLRLPTLESFMTIGVLGLGAHERFSLKSACDFFIAFLATTRYPSPLEPLADTALKHFGPAILRAILLSAGSEAPRSVIPNLAELLASFVQRIPGQEVMQWMTTILAEDGFPDPRATPAKPRLKEVVLKSRTTKKMREALHEFALVARGLDNTTYGNATAV